MAFQIKSPFNPSLDIFGHPMQISGNQSLVPKLKPGGLGYENSPSLAIKEPKQPAIPPDRSRDYLKDPTLRDSFADAVDRYREDERRRQAAIDAAIKRATDSGNKLQDLFENRIKNILDSLPSAPFTDALRNQLTTQGVDRINQEGEQLRRTLTSNTYNRGLSSGGSQATEGRTNIDLSLIGERNTLATDIATKQLDVNTKANQFKQGLLAELTGAQAQTGTANAGVVAQLGLGGAGLMNPEYVSNLIGDAASAQIGLTTSDNLLTAIQKAIDANQPDILDKLLTFAQDFANLSGRPRLGLGLGALGDL